ncbi:UNVERIFIED_CONTAM: hypothetical protein FKN15_036664 [Acipenser sinensis]
MKIRVAMCHMIFKKALCLSNTALGKTTTGQIVNLLSNDVNKFDEVTIFLHFLWIGPLQAAAVTALLWQEIGPSCLAGMAILLFLMPLQTCFGRLFSKLRSKTAAFTDTRIRTMNEVVSGMRIIKMYAWEKPFAKLVTEIRRKEISKVKKSSYLRGMNMASFFVANKIILFITFTTFVLLGNPISASKVFVTVSLYSAVSLTVTLFFPSAIERASETMISIRRIKDVDILPDGDMTVIGDRGATLSGGQKARVNLARAVYQDTDIYLLDDPLSAVDAEVGRHLFEKCICGVLRNKPRILVTHQLQYLQAADQILVLKEGHMVAKGTYGELQRSGVDFTSLLKQDEDDEQAPTEQNGSRSARCRTISENSVWSQTSSSQSTKDGTADLPPAEAVTTVLSEESRSEGSIGVRLYWKYFIAGANCAVLLLLFLLNLLAQTTYILQDWWLSYWASKQKKLNVTQGAHNHNETQQLDLGFYLGVYAGLTVVTVIFGFLRSLLFFKVLVNSAQTLHNQMFQSILRTPVRFFDINPIAVSEVCSAPSVQVQWSEEEIRSLISCIQDLGVMGQLDQPKQCNQQTFLQIVGVIAVAVSVIPWIIIPLIPLLIIFIILRRYFLQTSRDIKRLESTRLWTIRAFKAEQRFQREFDEHQDLHSESWFLFLTTSRWFAVRLDGLCAIFVTTIAFGSLLLANELEAGDVGLALSYAVTLIGMFQWGVRQSAEVENQMTSVERVLDYTELESEAPWVTECRPPPDWPRHGVIVFEGVNFAYSHDGPHVLKNMHAVFRSKEKVGVVGRTGAGKSSVISALFRLAEPDGNIRIDGVLTSELGLHDLRMKMSIIPQVYMKRSRPNAVPNGQMHTMTSSKDTDPSFIVFESAL